MGNGGGGGGVTSRGSNYFTILFAYNIYANVYSQYADHIFTSDSK